MAESLTGRIIAGRFRVGECLGQGGYGGVYEATQLSIERPVALKVLHPHLADRASVALRFEREARLASRLRHPNAAGVIDFGSDGDTLFLVMELIRGPTLRRYLADRGTLPPAAAARICSGIAGALDAAHQLGMVHRDLKPSNVLLQDADREPAPVVIDFGLAKIFEGDDRGSTLTESNVMIGTPAYMSPESVLGRGEDGRSDLYALGIILFELLTGAPPFRGNTAVETATRHAMDTPPDVASRCPAALPPGMAALTMQLLAKTPDLRPQSAAAVAQALLSFCEPGDRETVLLARPSDAPLLSEVPARPPPRPAVAAADRDGAAPTEAVALAIPTGPGGHTSEDASTASLPRDAAPSPDRTLAPGFGPGAAAGRSAGAALARTAPSPAPGPPSSPARRDGTVAPNPERDPSRHAGSPSAPAKRYAPFAATAAAALAAVALFALFRGEADPSGRDGLASPDPSVAAVAPSMPLPGTGPATSSSIESLPGRLDVPPRGSGDASALPVDSRDAAPSPNASLAPAGSGAGIGEPPVLGDPGVSPTGERRDRLHSDGDSDDRLVPPHGADPQVAGTSSAGASPGRASPTDERATESEPDRQLPPAGVPERPSSRTGDSGFVSVSIDPFGSVWIDGERVGDAPIRRQPLSPGPHLVESEYRGVRQSTRVTIREGETETVRHIFSR